MKAQRSPQSSCCGCDDDPKPVRSHNNEDDHDHDHGDGGLKQEIKVVAIVVALFLVGILFEKQLHTTPFSIAEYAVLGATFLKGGCSMRIS
jgi:Cd2+/Zn2+-exporting ATPase